MSDIVYLSKLYRRYLSQFVIARYARDLVQRLVKSLYKARYCSRNKHPVYRIASGFRSSTVGSGVIQVIYGGAKLTLNGPRILNGARFDLSNQSKPKTIDVPEFVIWFGNDVSYLGGTSFTFCGDNVFLPAQVDIENDGFVAESFGIVSIDRDSLNMRVCPKYDGKVFDAGISLIGQNATNYAHWMTEILSKCVILSLSDELRDIPLLVDVGLPKNMYESLRYLFGEDREIICVDRWELVKVVNSVTISQPGYEPYLQDGIHERKISSRVTAFSPEIFQRMNNILQTAHMENAATHGNRIYLSRGTGSSNMRRLINACEIEDCLREYQFEAIDSAALSFAEQVAACRAAEIIVVPVGAALANMILAPKGCMIIALAPYYAEANYYYYSNLAEVLGHCFYYLLGKQISSRHHPMHRDYEINIVELKQVIDDYISGLNSTRKLVDLRVDS